MIDYNQAGNFIETCDRISTLKTILSYLFLQYVYFFQRVGKDHVLND